MYATRYLFCIPPWPGGYDAEPTAVEDRDLGDLLSEEESEELESE